MRTTPATLRLYSDATWHFNYLYRAAGNNEISARYVYLVPVFVSDRCQLVRKKFPRHAAAPRRINLKTSNATAIRHYRIALAILTRRFWHFSPGEPRVMPVLGFRYRVIFIVFGRIILNFRRRNSELRKGNASTGNSIISLELAE